MKNYSIEYLAEDGLWYVAKIRAYNVDQAVAAFKNDHPECCDWQMIEGHLASDALTRYYNEI